MNAVVAVLFIHPAHPDVTAGDMASAIEARLEGIGLARGITGAVSCPYSGRAELAVNCEGVR